MHEGDEATRGYSMGAAGLELLMMDELCAAWHLQRLRGEGACWRGVGMAEMTWALTWMEGETVGLFGAGWCTYAVACYWEDSR